MSQDRMRQLNKVGFVWNPFGEKWEIGFKQFKLFVDCEGHCLVGDKYIDTDGYPLGNWVGTQRQTKKKMSISKVERLDALGFIWNALEHRWETGLTYLKKFKELEGHCQVKKAHETYDGFQLGSWVRTQRKFKDRLPVNRIKKLNAVGFIWNTSKDKN